MNRRYFIWAIPLLIIAVALLPLIYAAGSAVVETGSKNLSPGGSVQFIKAAWTADDGTGSVAIALTGLWDGKVMYLATVPGTAGTQPDDNYDLTITDGNSLDILSGAGANRDELNTEYVLGTSLGAVAMQTLTLNVSNAGNSNTGTVYVWIK